MSAISFYDQCAPSLKEESGELKEQVEKGGYGAFRDLVEQFKEAIRKATDREEEDVNSRITVAERLFPEPAKFSPSWQNIWSELKKMMYWKAFVYRSVPEASRTGEWQILMDNPYVNQEVVCYPGLSFEEAANLFAYFRPTLLNNEYLRLQKIETAITESGSA